MDPLGRTALVLAVENENMELIEVLLKYNINPGDTLLHAINEEYVEAVEILLQYEESIHVSGSLYVCLNWIKSNFKFLITINKPLVMGESGSRNQHLHQGRDTSYLSSP